MFLSSFFHPTLNLTQKNKLKLTCFQLPYKYVIYPKALLFHISTLLCSVVPYTTKPPIFPPILLVRTPCQGVGKFAVLYAALLVKQMILTAACPNLHYQPMITELRKLMIIMFPSHMVINKRVIHHQSSRPTTDFLTTLTAQRRRSDIL